jgi:hypothetical protein
VVTYRENASPFLNRQAGRNDRATQETQPRARAPFLWTGFASKLGLALTRCRNSYRPNLGFSAVKALPSPFSGLEGRLISDLWLRAMRKGASPRSKIPSDKRRAMSSNHPHRSTWRARLEFFQIRMRQAGFSQHARPRFLVVPSGTKTRGITGGLTAATETLDQFDLTMPALADSSPLVL